MKKSKNFWQGIKDDFEAYLIKENGRKIRAELTEVSIEPNQNLKNGENGRASYARFRAYLFAKKKIGPILGFVLYFNGRRIRNYDFMAPIDLSRNDSINITDSFSQEELFEENLSLPGITNKVEIEG